MTAVAPPLFVVFALTPALANPDPVDYATSEGMKLYKSATERLTHTFDSETGSLRLFLQALQLRADSFGWASVLMVPDINGVPRNLITEYGQVTMTDVTNHALTHVHNQTRMAQNSSQLFTCVYDSLLLEALLKISTDSSAYRLTSAVNPNFIVASGACFLKLLITRCTVDTRSTVATIRRSLNNLDVYMGSVIFEFSMMLYSPVEKHRLISSPTC